MGCFVSKPKGGPSKATARQMKKEAADKKEAEKKKTELAVTKEKEVENPISGGGGGGGRGRGGDGGRGRGRGGRGPGLTTKSSTMVITPEEWAHEEAQQAARPIKKYDTFYCNGQRWTFNNKIIKKEGQQDDDGWVWNGRVVWKVGSSLLDGWDWDGDALSKHEKSHDDSKIRPMKATLKQLLVHWNVQMEVPPEE